MTPEHARSLRGRLVVASPELSDPNFRRTVVLLLEHTPEGALGVVLNRPSEVLLSDAMPDWRALAAPPTVVFVGGPVQQSAVIGLARSDGGASLHNDWEAVSDRVGVINLGSDPVLRAIDLEAVRVFAGYAGWAGGQLESEVDAGSWFVLDADDQDGFASEPEGLWLRVLRRQGGLFATMPEDPSTN